jgi:hypothetical protein
VHGPVRQDREDGGADIAATDGVPAAPVAEEAVDAVVASVVAKVVAAATAAALDTMRSEVHGFLPWVV